MISGSKFSLLLAGSVLLSTAASAQVPDVLNSLDAGGRSLGQGGALNVTNSDTLSSYYNPATLGYLDKREIGVTYRNLPESRSQIFNTRSDPRYVTDGIRGTNSFTHFGYVVPLKDLFRKGTGTLGFSYVVGGYLNDIGTGPNGGLPDGSLTINNYRRTLEAKSEFFTVSYGKTNASQSFSYGAGLTVVQQKIGFAETGTSSISLPSVSSTGTGVGVLLGAQFVPKNMPNVSYGLSYRSEINLSNNERTADLYDKIPARLMFGTSYRQDNLRGGKDFAVLGAQIQHYFAGNNSIGFDRNAQTLFGLGVEYNYTMESARIPIRIGYLTNPAGGDGYGRRNLFTYGIGYRPAASAYGLDLNWAAPSSGGYDFSISATYRFK